MTHSPITEDIDFVRQMAEEGAVAPTLGGRFNIWWGTLVTIALVCHWAALTGLLPLASNKAGIIWMTMGIVGAIGSIILGRSLKDKPGQFTPGNRAEGTVWPVITVSIFLYAIAIALAVGLRDQPYLLFNTIIPLAFILNAVGAAISATLYRRSTPWLIVIASLLLAGLCAFLIDQPVIYLIAAIGVFITQVIPGIFDMRAEPKSVV